MRRDELRDYLATVQVDFVCPHRPRDAGASGQTAAKTREYLLWLHDLGRVVPVHHQEPFRRGYRPREWEPGTDDFLTDLTQAKLGEARDYALRGEGSEYIVRNARLVMS